MMTLEQNETLIGLGFRKGVPFTAITREADGGYLLYDIYHKPRASSHSCRALIRECCGTSHEVEFADDVDTYWLRRGLTLDERQARRMNARRISALPRR